MKTAAFGAFISLLPGRDGLLHISKVGDGKRVERVEDFLNVGDKVEVEIAEIDARGKIDLDKVPARGRTPAGTPDGGRAGPSARRAGPRRPGAAHAVTVGGGSGGRARRRQRRADAYRQGSGGRAPPAPPRHS